MWDVRVRVQESGGRPLAGHTVRVAFRLRLGGAGPEGGIPAEASGQTDAGGGLSLTLPSATGLAETLQITVTGPDGKPIYDAPHPRDSIGEELLITLGEEEAPTRLVLTLLREGGGAPVPDIEILLLARAVGSDASTIALMGKTDAQGRLEGSYPAGPFAEVNALIRLQPDRIQPIPLRDGALPARVALSAPAAPPARTPTPTRTPPPLLDLDITIPPDLLPEDEADGDADPDAPADEPALPEESGRRGRRRRRRSSSRALPDQRTLGVLGAVVFVGALLRLYSLGGPSLGSSELESWRQTAYNSLAKVVDHGVVPTTHPPGYALILYLWEGLGNSEWTLRTPSALAGIATLVFVFLLGRRLWSDREGLLAAGLMGVLWAPVRYSQDVGATGLTVMFSTLTTWLWLDLLREIDRRGRLEPGRSGAYILSATVLAYLSYYGLVLVGLQGVGALGYALWRDHRRSAAAMAAAVYVAIGVLYLPWAGHLVEDITGAGSWITEPSAPTRVAFFGYLEFLFNRSDVLTVGVLLLVGAAGFVSAFSALRASRFNFSFRSGWLAALLWLVLPFFVVWFKGLWGKPALSDVDLLLSAPAAYLLVARAITAFPIPNAGTALLSAVVLGLSFLNFASMGYYGTPNRPQIREAVQAIVDHGDDAKDVFIVTTGNPADIGYYLTRLGEGKDIQSFGDDNLSRLKKKIRNKKPTLLWRLQEGDNDADPAENYLGKVFHEVDHQAFFGVNLTLYKREGDYPEASADEEEDGGGDSDTGNDATAGARHRNSAAKIKDEDKAARKAARLATKQAKEAKNKNKKAAAAASDTGG